MKRTFSILSIVLLILQACGQSSNSNKETGISQDSYLKTIHLPKPEGKTIEGRFEVPEVYKRVKVDRSSFESYLRNLPLKPVGSTVRYFNGGIKQNRDVYDAVIDLPIGKWDLHQCADAVMRLRAEYLHENKEYDSIHFNFTNGFLADYSKWMNGQRISVTGNDVRWKTGGTASKSYDDLWKYLEMVFSYAGTASL